MIPIIVTTINPPSKGLKKLRKYGKIIVAGDMKTPENWEMDGAIYLSVEEQDKRYKKFSKALPRNQYARKNLAYLPVLGEEYLFETDDDNLPENNFEFFTHDLEAIEVNGDRAINTSKLFTKELIWPRGLPLSNIHSLVKKGKKKKIKPKLVQSLANRDSDVDAIYRLVLNKMIKYKSGLMFCVKNGTYAPFNTQCTLWHKSLYPLLYFPSTVSYRVADIWRSYIAQRIMWEMGEQVLISSPIMYQNRNYHDLMVDFVDELRVYTDSQKLLDELDSLKLSGSVEQMLLRAYKRLVKMGFFERQELELVRLWLKYF